MPQSWATSSGVTLTQGTLGTFSFTGLCGSESWTMPGAPGRAILVEKATPAGDSWGVVWNAAPAYSSGGAGCVLNVTQVVSFRAAPAGSKYALIALVDTTFKPTSQCNAATQTLEDLTGVMVIGMWEVPNS